MFLLQCVPFFAFSFLDLSYVLLSFVSKRNGLFAYFSQFFLVFLCIFNNLEFREGQIFFVHSTKRLTHITYFPAFFLYTMPKDIYTRLEESHHAISGMAQALVASLYVGRRNSDCSCNAFFPYSGCKTPGNYLLSGRFSAGRLSDCLPGFPGAAQKKAFC